MLWLASLLGLMAVGSVVLTDEEPDEETDYDQDLPEAGLSSAQPELPLFEHPEVASADPAEPQPEPGASDEGAPPKPGHCRSRCERNHHG